MRLMKTADQPVQRPPAALTRSSCRAEWIGTAQDGTSQQAPRTDVDASAELSDREKDTRALYRRICVGEINGHFQLVSTYLSEFVTDN